MTTGEALGSAAAVRDTRAAAAPFASARPTWLAPLFLALLAAGVVVAAIAPWPVGVFQDDGIYVVLAKSLAGGEGYRFLQMPGAPNATHYPPGYPVFLAALWKLYPSFPENVTLFKFANAALMGVVAWGTWHFARTRAGLGPVASGAVTALFTACTPIVLLSVMVLSEPLFLALLLPAVGAAERVAASGKPRDAVVAGLAAGALAMVRTLGILVVPAAALVLVLRRQWRAAATLAAVAMAVMLPWQLWVSAHADEVPSIFLGKYGSYTGWLMDAIRTEGPGWLLRVGRHNLGKLAFETWTHTSTVLLPTAVRVASTVMVAGLFLWGLVVAWRRLPATTLFVLGYLGVVVIWPFAPARFVWGIWPLVGLVLALGVQGMAGGAGDRTERRVMAMVVAGPLVAGYLLFNYQSTREGWWTQVQGSVANRARPLAEWVNANTPNNAVLATDDDVLVYLYTGRRTIPNGAFTAQEHLVPQTPAFAVANLRTILATYHVDYVLAGTEYATYAVRGLVQATPPELRIVTPLKVGAVFAPVGAVRR